MPLDWEQSDDIGVAVIDRPDRRNALNVELCEALRDRLAGTRLRAVIITGAGDKAFCAGADLARRAADLGNGGTDQFRPVFDELLDAIVTYPAPIVAAVNGAALGAGMQLAVACDLRVVAPHAVFGIPAGRLGVMLSAPNILRLAEIVGQATARDLLLTARTLTADEADVVGLVQRRADDALSEARSLASSVARLAPISLSGHKRALNLLSETSVLTPAVREEIERLEAAAFGSADLQEGLAAFAEKREPRFRGA